MKIVLNVFKNCKNVDVDDRCIQHDVKLYFVLFFESEKMA